MGIKTYQEKNTKPMAQKLAQSDLPGHITFLKSPLQGQKKIVVNFIYMGIKTYQEKNTKPMEKELAQSDLPVRRKIQKTI